MAVHVDLIAVYVDLIVGFVMIRYHDPGGRFKRLGRYCVFGSVGGLRSGVVSRREGESRGRRRLSDESLKLFKASLIARHPIVMIPLVKLDSSLGTGEASGVLKMNMVDSLSHQI
jgi:hypothetical protein